MAGDSTRANAGAEAKRDVIKMQHIAGVDASRLLEAKSLHAAGKLAAAEALYRELLSKTPSNPEIMHLLGALVLEIHKEDATEREEGRKLLQAAINASPSNAKYRYSLGVAYQRLGRKAEAVEAFERANEKDPMNVQTLMALGRALKEAGRPQRAAEIYKAVTKLEPDHPTAYYKAASLLKNLGKHEEAVAGFRQHLRLHPNDTDTLFWIAAITGDNSVAATPADLVAGLFDQYADTFDDHLVNKLGYQTPQLLLGALLEAVSQVLPSPPQPSGPPAFRRCIDLGCGTGLMGPLVRPYVGYLEGVDLSKGMVEKARERKGCYDSLAVAELVAHLTPPSQAGTDPADGAPQGGEQPSGSSSSSPCATSRPQQHQQRPGSCLDYDLFLAADVFVYIGDLLPVLRAAAARAAPGALFAFSTETPGPSSSTNCSSQVASSSNQSISSSNSSGISNDVPTTGFRITPTGRYQHTRHYAQEVLQEAGWRVLLVRDQVIRMNAGKPVHGQLCVAQGTG